MRKLFMRVLASVTILVIVVIAVSCSCGDKQSTKPAGDVIVPIEFQNAKSVGSINIRFNYDSSKLKLNNVVGGELAQNAMLEYNAAIPGLIAIGVIDSKGINGNGAVVKIGFDATGTTGTSPLKLELIETHNAETLIEILNESTDGSYNAQNRETIPPRVNFTD